MITVQPYFVLAASQYYKRVVMDYGIAHIYHYQRNDSDAVQVQAIPDGSVDLFFEKTASRLTAKVCGSVLSGHRLQTRSGYEYFGIRFMPGVLPGNLSVKMPELVEQELDFDDALQDRETVRKIAGTEDWQTCIQLYLQDYFRHRELPAETETGKALLASYLCRNILARSGHIRMEALARASGYSLRYVQKVFQQYLGMSPKQFSEILMFQTAIQGINQVQKGRLTEIAMASGYFDQAHFIRSFKKYCRITPAAYRKLVCQNAYWSRMDIEDVSGPGQYLSV